MSVSLKTQMAVALFEGSAMFLEVISGFALD